MTMQKLRRFGVVVVVVVVVVKFTIDKEFAIHESFFLYSSKEKADLVR